MTLEPQGPQNLQNPRTFLERSEERDKVRLVLRREADVEALVVEVHRLHACAGR